MKKFIAIFKCAENSTNHDAWKKLSTEEQIIRLGKGQELSNHWIEKYYDKIIYNTPLYELTKVVNQEGIFDAPSQVGALIIIEAESHEDAANMFLNHPHFTYFPGDCIDIVECKSRRNNG